MGQSTSHSPLLLGVVVAALALAMLFLCGTEDSPEPCNLEEGGDGAIVSIERQFQEQIQPLLKTYCIRCHTADEMTSGIRVDHLVGSLPDEQLFLWKDIQRQVEGDAMPPEDEPQPTPEERRRLTAWIHNALDVARARAPQKNGAIRRLTVSQYRNTLRDLLGLGDSLTDVLPPDAVSKDGFVNNSRTMQLSPLLVESYFDIADQALDRCIVDEKSLPVIQNFRMDLGASINPKPCPDKLILGALSHLLENRDFLVTQLKPAKPFDVQPFAMRTKYRFIEGYQGNDTVRGWRNYDSISHAVFACMRGTDGYPKGDPYQVVPDGLLLRPAIPSSELFGNASTYGPRANFKISLRELPDHGRFRVNVKAAKYDDGLLLDSGTGTPAEPTKNAITVTNPTAQQTVQIEKAGLYQADVYLEPAQKNASQPAVKKQQRLVLQLGKRQFSGILAQPAFLVVRLPAGSLAVSAHYGKSSPLHRIVLTPLNETQDIAKRFKAFEKRSPRIGVHVGLRRDCGSTLTQVGEPQTVSSGELREFVFEGAISNFPSPDVEKDNVNYLAGIREIGVRSEFTDGRDMPRLLIRSVEFEGPFYECWPPATHRKIFIDSDSKDNPTAYAHQVIRSFATRAFRRPITVAEEASLVAIWKRAFAETGDFRQSIKDSLLIVLTSPQFLFQIENSATPEAEKLDPYELASKLSYFLWNTAPDERLLMLAGGKTLHHSLDAEITRMIRDRRFRQFASEFTSQWLSLDKFGVVETDRKRFPTLTRDTKTQLRKEPERFLQYLIQHNLPLRNLIRSDFIVANEVVAGYYGLADRTESGFQFVPISHGRKNFGGVLSQAGILAALSDGRESNPVKRGAWLARKILAEPPDDPPPNVPALTEINVKNLTLRQKLELHRSQKTCAKCHAGIDPWGIPFEQFDAGGLFKKDVAVDARSTLPDKTEVTDFNGLQAYLANDRLDQVAFSFLYHLTSYAVGRKLSYNEIEYLKREGLKLKPNGYRMQDMFRFVIKSPIFLEK